jgi:hypothetical protein
MVMATWRIKLSEYGDKLEVNEKGSAEIHPEARIV